MICMSWGGGQKKPLGSSLEEMPGRTSRHRRGARQVNTHPGWSQGWWLVPAGCRWWVAGEPPGWHRVPQGGCAPGRAGDKIRGCAHSRGQRALSKLCPVFGFLAMPEQKLCSLWGHRWLPRGCSHGGAGGEGRPDSRRTLSPWGDRHGKVHAWSSHNSFPNHFHSWRASAGTPARSRDGEDLKIGGEICYLPGCLRKAGGELAAAHGFPPVPV